MLELPYYAVEILLALLTILVSLYLYLTRTYGYWKDKGVFFIKPVFPFGSIKDQILGRVDAGTFYQRWYTEYKKKGLKYVGAYSLQQPTLVLLDLDLCRLVLTRDFNHFMSREFTPTTHEYISKNLFALDGQEWKDMRVKISPTFTSGKMKNMIPLMKKCAIQLQEHIDDVVLKKGEFDVRDLIARFTTDIIATCAFGLEVNSIKDRENEFFQTGQLIFVPKVSFFLKVLYFKNFPKTAKVIKVNFFDTQITEVLTRVVKETVEYRKRCGVCRNDFIDLLLKVKDNQNLDEREESEKSNKETKEGDSDVSIGLTLEEMTAQAFVFFAAGFETAASTTSFCLYELAKNPEVQERLRREIDEVLSNHGGEITYQALQDMTYMDQVMNETLRMYATLPFLTRVCTEPYQIPGADFVIDEGVRVNVPTYAIHYDPEIYPDPYKFDPDRFTEEMMKNRHPYAFLPFGEGPRICVGLRFGKLQVKIGLATILSKYSISLTPTTPAKLELNPFIPITIPRYPFSLRISSRSD